MHTLLINPLAKRERVGNLRKLHLREDLIDFSSNDYLGLARSSKLAGAILEEWQDNQYRLGSTGSRLLTGHSLYAEKIEMAIADFHGYEAGLIFGSGYAANVGLLSAVIKPEDSVFFDLHVHASIHDGIRLARGKGLPFWHNDIEHLEKRLKKNQNKGNRFICIESLYSTDGSKAPLDAIANLALKYDAHLIVDEAHAVGVEGPEGRGLVAANNLQSKIFAQVATFGKAIGIYGSIVLGSKLLKEYLINFARSCIYSTFLPFPVLAGIKCSYDFFPFLEKERSHLRKLSAVFSNKTHIQGIAIKGNREAKKMASTLAAKGFDVRPLLSPTVQRGEERLRICLHAFNSENEVRSLLNEICNG